MAQSFSKEQRNGRSQSVKARRREGVWWKNKLRDGIKERQGRCTEARSDGGFDRTCTYSRVPGLREQRRKKRKKHSECERAREGKGAAEQRQPATRKRGEQQEKGGKSGRVWSAITITLPPTTRTRTTHCIDTKTSV